MTMNFDELYPRTPITNIEYTDREIIIHTQKDPAHEKNTVEDLPMFDKRVIVKIASSKRYPWMSLSCPYYSWRLIDFISTSKRYVPEGFAFEAFLSTNHIYTTVAKLVALLTYQEISGCQSTLKLNNFRKSQTRGAKSSIDYQTLREIISDVLAKGIPKEENVDCLFPVTTYHKVTSYRELLTYLKKKNPAFSHLSLQTLHQFVHTNFPNTVFQHYASDGRSFYRSVNNDLTQLYFEEIILPDAKLRKTYKKFTLRPHKFSLTSMEEPAILKEVISQETLSCSMSLSVFRDAYSKWMSNFLLFFRLIPTIILEDGNLHLIISFYDVKYKAFATIRNSAYLTELPPLPVNVRGNSDGIGVLLYPGQYRYAMDGFERSGALQNMVFPDGDEIEIGFGEYVRFSSSDTHYLIPKLESKIPLR